MSTLKVDTIRDNGSGFNDVVTFANSGGTENARLCRGFVNFNGQGAVAIRSNFNVNSITDNAEGKYTVNFANAMVDGNYVCFGGGRRSMNQDEGGEISINTGFDTFNTGSVRMSSQDNNSDNYFDSSHMFFVLFR